MLTGTHGSLWLATGVLGRGVPARFARPPLPVLPIPSRRAPPYDSSHGTLTLTLALTLTLTLALTLTLTLTLTLALALTLALTLALPLTLPLTLFLPPPL